MARLFVGLVLLIVGFNALFDLNLWQYFWPGILIVLGAYVLLGKPGDTHHHASFEKHDGVESGKNHFSYSAILQGIDRKIVTDDFRGGEIETVLGGMNLDLREAKIKSKDPVSLKIDATLGGVKILVPKTWKIENQMNGVAGGIHDTTVHPSEKDHDGTLRIFGSATLGGVEINN